MKFTKVRDVKSPKRANDTDAGIDFFVPEGTGTVTLTPGDSCLIASGIKVNVPKGYALVAFNKSGVATKKGLQVGACVVDCGYQGEVHIHLVNIGQEYTQLLPGDKVVQFVLLKLGNPILEEVSEENLYEEESNRGDGGFGSTGTK